MKSSRYDRKEDLELFGLNIDATASAIKKAYHVQAREFHPDKNSTEDTQEKFQKINDAYKRLQQTSEKIQKPDEPLKKKYEYFSKQDLRDDKTWKFIGEFKTKLNALIILFSEQKVEEEDVKNYVIENKKKFQEAVTCTVSIDPLIDTFLKVDNFDLLLLLDANWIKELYAFNHAPTFSRFLGYLNPEYWNTFFDDFLGLWLKGFCSNVSNFATLCDTLPTSYPKVGITYDRFGTEDTLLDYLGQAWLREICFCDTNKLAYLFKLCHIPSRIEPIFKLLNGEDKWLNTVVDGAGLGNILMSINEKGSVPPNSVVEDWNIFFKYFDLSSIINTPIQLNALLTHLVIIPFTYSEHKGEIKKYNEFSTNNIVIFLQTYVSKRLDHHYITDLKQLIDELLNLSHTMENDSASYTVIKNIGIIRAFSHQAMYEILFFNRVETPVAGSFKEIPKTVQEVLSQINFYKNQPYYKALILAVAKGYYYKRSIENESQSYFGHTKKDKLESAESLITSIIADEPIDKKKFPALAWGDLGDISKLYMGDSGMMDTFKHYLLGSSIQEISQPALLEEEMLQLTYVKPPKASGP